MTAIPEPPLDPPLPDEVVETMNRKLDLLDKIINGLAAAAEGCYELIDDMPEIEASLSLDNDHLERVTDKYRRLKQEVENGD